MDLKRLKPRSLAFAALRCRRHPQRFHAVDAEGLEHGAEPDVVVSHP